MNPQPLEPSISLPGGVFISVPLGTEPDPGTRVRPLKPTTTNASRVAAALCREIELRAAGLKGRAFDTVFFGGCGASFLTLDQLYRTLQSLYDNLSIVPREQSLVAAAGTIDAPLAKVLRESGFDRVELRPGRQPVPSADVAVLRDAGFETVGLRAGYETEAGKRALGVESLLRLEPDHVALDFADGPDREGAGLDSLLAFRFYRDRLSGAYENYALHHFCRPGKESQHLMSRWESRPLFGLGPGAATLLDEDEFTNDADVGGYLRAVESGEPAARLRTPARVAEIRNRLLRRAGVSPADVDAKKCRELTARGLLVLRSDSLFLTDQGVLALDRVSRELSAAG